MREIVAGHSEEQRELRAPRRLRRDVPPSPVQDFSLMASQSQPSPSQSRPRCYYLKVSRSSPSTRYAGRYVRYTGGGHSDVVLTEAHPVYLRFFLQNGKQLASFNDRAFGFVMSKRNEDSKSQLTAVEMFEDEGDQGFWFDDDDGGKLKWRSTGMASSKNAWSGWVLRDSPPDRYKGNPQLFWVTGEDASGELENLERVDLVAEHL